MVRKCITILLVFSVFGAQGLFAQRPGATDANIYGHIVDGATGEHLPYAFVRLVEQGTGTAADSTGHYFIANLREGHHTVEVTLMGYQTVTKLIEAGPLKDSGFIYGPAIPRSFYFGVKLDF